MKRIHCLLVLALPIFANADDHEVREQIMSRHLENVQVTLNSSTVKCSAQDYSEPFLKVLIPELADLTLFDHRNFREGAPCVAAGTCRAGNRPENILNEVETEEVQIEVTEKRAFHIDHLNKTCEVFLFENVRVPIRGRDFVHERSSSLGTRFYEDCLR